MCEFVSWIEKDDSVLFLTGDDVFYTKKGKGLQKYCKESIDLAGHGAIYWYFDIQNKVGIIEKECIDFSKPDNFPVEIVKAIKAGKMRGLGISKQLLTKPAYAKYDKIERPAYAKYNKIKLDAYAEYEKIEQAAYTEYDKIKLDAYDEYEKIEQAAYDEYKKITQNTFWDLFAKKSNRNPLWR